MNKSISPSRQYVAVCSKEGGYYFRTFKLPDRIGSSSVENDSETASWYFLNHLNSYACIEGCVTLEDFQDVTPERQSN